MANTGSGPWIPFNNPHPSIPFDPKGNWIPLTTTTNKPYPSIPFDPKGMGGALPQTPGKWMPFDPSGAPAPTPTKKNNGLDQKLRNVWKFAVAGPLGFGMIKGGGGGGAPSAPLVPPTASQEDILSGKIPVDHIDINSDTFKKFQQDNPQLAQAISDKKNYQYSQLQSKYLSPTSQQGTISPAAIQLLFQNSINPLIESLNKQQHGTTEQYGGLMQQLAKSLPAPYAKTLSAQIPLQQNLNNQFTDASSQTMAQAPVLNMLLQQLNQDYTAQQRTQADLIRYGGAQQGGGTDLASILAAQATG